MIEEASLPTIHVAIQTQTGPLRLTYLDVGSGPTLLLLHGMFGDHLDWEPVIGPLSRHFRVIAVDLPGFGDSDKPDVVYDRDLFVGAVRTLLDCLRLPSVTLVGNSFGGLLALLFALDYPDRVDALVLVGSGGLQPLEPAAIERARRSFSEESLLALTPEIQNVMFSPVFAHDAQARLHYVERQNAKLARPDFRAYVRAISRTIQFVLRTSCKERLGDLQCQTLLLWGERDTVMPSVIAIEAAVSIRRAQVKLLQGCGHAPQLECPEGFTRALTEFVRGHVASA